MQANYQPKIINARKTRKSVECLQDERNMLLKEVKDLKEKNQFQKEAIEKYRVNNQTQYVELKFRWRFSKSPSIALFAQDPIWNKIRLSFCTFMEKFFN